MSILARNALAAAVAALLSVSIAACSRDTDVAETNAAMPDAVYGPAGDTVSPAADADVDPAMGQPALLAGCDAEAAQAHVGKEATDAVIEQARIDSGSDAVRALGPGDAATMDFRPDRLNIDLDDDNIIQSLRCG